METEILVALECVMLAAAFSEFLLFSTPFPYRGVPYRGGDQCGAASKGEIQLQEPRLNGHNASYFLTVRKRSLDNQLPRVKRFRDSRRESETQQ